MNQTNFNLYEVLKQDSGYQAKVKQREAEMEYVTRMNERAEKRAVEQAEISEKVSKEMDILSSMIEGLENPDVDRVKAVEEDARKIIMEGVKASNGDMKSFILNGGMSKIRQYKNAVMQSDTLQTAQKNALRMKAMQDDFRKGKIHDRVNINGQMATSKDLINMFYNNEISELPALKAYNTPKFNVKDFRDMYNPLSPHSSTLVDRQTVINHIAQKNGVSFDVAEQSIEDMVTPEGYVEGVYWGVKDGDNWKSNSTRANNANRNTGGRKGKIVTKQQLGKLKTYMRFKDVVQTNIPTDDGMERVDMGRYDLSAKDVRNIFTNVFDVGIDADGKFTDGIKGMIRATNLSNLKTFDISGHAYEIVQLGTGLTNVATFKKDENGQTMYDAEDLPIADKDELYATAQIFMTEDAYDNWVDKQDISKRQLDNISNSAEYMGVEGYTLDIGLYLNLESPSVATEFLQSIDVPAIEAFEEGGTNIQVTPWGTNEDVNTVDYQRKQDMFFAIRNDFVKANPNVDNATINSEAKKLFNRLNP
jgi:hypothetical protein